MGLMCNSCFSIIKQLNDNRLCPLASCNGETVYIDDDFVNLISGLNKNGFTTDFCCAGHYSHHTCYILFNLSQSEEYLQLNRHIFTENIDMHMEDIREQYLPKWHLLLTEFGSNGVSVSFDEYYGNFRATVRNGELSTYHTSLEESSNLLCNVRLPFFKVYDKICSYG